MAISFTALKDECDKTIKHYKTELSRLRTGRAHTSLLDGLHVDYYGTSVPIIQVALLAAPEPRLITVQVFDQNAVEAVEKAIKQSDLGLNPSRDGSTLRVSLPSLTEERRKELIKKLHKMSEDTKVILRNHRRDQMDLLKKQEKDKVIGADEHKRANDEVQKIIDKHTAEVDVLTAAKEKEMMEV